MPAEDDDAVAEALALVERLPGAVIEAVFRRYGKPIDLVGGQAHPRIAQVEGRAATVRALRIRLPVDVIANDWFVFEVAGADALAVPGPLFAAALAALSRRG